MELENINTRCKVFGPVSEVLQNRIFEERDLKVPSKWLKKAARADSIEDFTEMLKNSYPDDIIT